MMIRYSVLKIVPFMLISSCGIDKETKECNPSTNGSEVQSLQINMVSSSKRITDAGVTVTLEISAEFPCLRGFITILVSSSVGTIGDNHPGMQFELALVPTINVTSSRLVGYVELYTPLNQLNRVDAIVGEFPITKSIDPMSP